MSYISFTDYLRIFVVGPGNPGNKMLILLETVRAIGVFPIPPAPMRAIGVRRSASPIIFPISPSRPKHTFGGGGGDSPSTLDVNARY